MIRRDRDQQMFKAFDGVMTMNHDSTSRHLDIFKGHALVRQEVVNLRGCEQKLLLYLKWPC